MRLKGKSILLGVGGGIAAYKIPSLLRLLQKEGALVRVFMSAASKNFVTPFLLQTLSDNPVTDEFFSTEEPFLHINASKNVDLFLITPTTAQMLAEFTHGFASNLISATVLAASCPVMLVPSMNARMWNNPLVQENVDKLRKNGIWVVNPQSGDLACGEVGEGRLPELEILLDEVIKSLTPQDLKGKKVIITAGPTYEFLDPIRFLSNSSSGKMGLALSLEAYYRGADVTLITSCHYRSLPQTIRIISVTSAAEMEKEVLSRALKNDIFIANAAVSDYRFVRPLPHKMKKNQKTILLQLIRNNDILFTLSQKKGKSRKPLMVGFSLETIKDGQKEAQKKFLQKGLDLMVYNDFSAIGSTETKVTFIFGKKAEQIQPLQEKNKEEAARQIFDKVLALKSF